MKHTMKESDSRISALDANGVEICGAYQPEGHEYWSLYVTQLVTRHTGLIAPPHREHFWGSHGRSIARSWIELIATLYCLGAEEKESVT